nr:LysR family transcriptional regulator substrate-binding protein [Agrobacterium vitis]
MFREQHPNVTVSLKVAASGDLLQQVEAGMIDVAFCFDRGSFDNRLATRLIAKEPVILIAPITGQYARGMPTLTEIGAVSFVATEVGCVYRAMFDKAFADFGHCL